MTPLRKTTIILISLFALLTVAFHQPIVTGEQFLDYRVDLKKQHIHFYWRDENNQPFKSIRSLKLWLEKRNKKLLFAANGGMFKPDHSPVGLFIEGGKTIIPPDTTSGEGNFYMKPNGVFYVTTDHRAHISTTENFSNKANINYATQSGPMLVINGDIHSSFKKGSTNLNIRNGVGLLADGRILFVMSKTAINFYDFAEHFKQAGCKNALYLDGFVSKTYLPSRNWVQEDGDFGVIIAETNK